MSSEQSQYEISQQLNSLLQLREQTQKLVNCKATLLQTTELLSSKKNILEELTAQKHRRLKEKRLLLDMLQGVQRDIELLTEMEDTLGRECDDLQRNTKRMRDEEYEPLHESVNQMRTDKGLTKITHVQQDREAEMAQKLKERRENWQHGVSPSSSPSSSIVSSPVDRTSPGTARRRATPSSSSTSQRGKAKKRRQ